MEAYCNTQQSGNFSQTIYTYLLYDKEARTTIHLYLCQLSSVQDGVSACTIAKVAGTTWHEHFLALGRGEANI